MIISSKRNRHSLDFTFVIFSVIIHPGHISIIVIISTFYVDTILEQDDNGSITYLKLSDSKLMLNNFNYPFAILIPSSCTCFAEGSSLIPSLMIEMDYVHTKEHSVPLEEDIL